jgi:AhpD family alkylhydroperoxidase
MAHPEKHMNSLDQAAYAHGDLDPRLREMIRVRASQLNGCAYCLSVHNEDARSAGEDQYRLDVLAGWREAGDLYDERERAALALVDAVTLMRDPGAAYDAAAEILTGEELDGVLWQAIAINAWNRQAVATHTRPEPLQRSSGSDALPT